MFVIFNLNLSYLKVGYCDIIAGNGSTSPEDGGVIDGQALRVRMLVGLATRWATAVTLGD